MTDNIKDVAVVKKPYKQRKPRSSTATTGKRRTATKKPQEASVAVAEHVPEQIVTQLKQEQVNLTKQLVYSNREVFRTQAKLEASEELLKIVHDAPLSVVIYTKWVNFLYCITKPFRE